MAFISIISSSFLCGRDWATPGWQCSGLLSGPVFMATLGGAEGLTTGSVFRVDSYQRLGNHMGVVPDIELRLTACKASDLPTVLFLWPLRKYSS